jgi:iron complex transport system permease protein
MNRRKVTGWIIAALLLWSTVLLMCSMMGPVRILVSDALRLWQERLMFWSKPATVGSSLSKFEVVYWQIRMPRLILATLTGMALASTGTAFQSVFRNPMADPYVLGISSGASLGASLAIVIGFESTMLGVTGMAFLFSIGSLALVFMIASRAGKISSNVLLLAGVAMSFLSTAIVSLLLFLHRDKVEQIVFWTLGGLNAANWFQIQILIPVVLIGVAVIFYYARHLNIMLLGTDTAKNLGVQTNRTILWVMLASSFMVAVVVANTGVIGFVGLIIPHIIRFITGPDNRKIIPLSVIAGAIFLMVSDTIARTLASPSELPVGSITALFGVPYFLFLLYQSQKRSV